MKKIIKYMLIIIVFALGITAVNHMNTIIHEDIHVAIAYNHGCINVTKQINFYESSWVRCEEYVVGRSDEVKNQKDMLDSLNEIVGYNVMTILFGMFVCTGAIIITMMVKDN